MDECKSKCISAGMDMMRQELSYKPEASSPVLFAENVLGLIPNAEDMKVPHSELAMHVKAAGKDILAWMLTRNYAYVVFDDAGCCGYTHGLPNEVLSHEIIRQTKEIWGPK